jgi:AspT/YidE/YbjL antiporter-like protein
VQRATNWIGGSLSARGGVDFVVMGFAIFLGGVFGVLAALEVGGVKISVGTSIGTLLAGLLVGHLRTQHPLFGRIPDGAVTFMTSLGLTAFVGLTGISAGPIFLSALREVGIWLLLGGAVVTLLPQAIGLLFGHFALRMNPILLLGALAGSQTVTAAMAAVQERSGSPVAVLGYAPAYAVANILLTIWGGSWCSRSEVLHSGLAGLDSHLILTLSANDRATQSHEYCFLRRIRDNTQVCTTPSPRRCSALSCSTRARMLRAPSSGIVQGLSASAEPRCFRSDIWADGPPGGYARLALTGQRRFDSYEIQ